VPASHWAYGSVEAIVKAGIMSSCGAPASFCPADTVTRGAMAQTLRPALLHGQ
jgi:hypothetical protein